MSEAPFSIELPDLAVPPLSAIRTALIPLQQTCSELEIALTDLDVEIGRYKRQHAGAYNRWSHMNDTLERLRQQSKRLNAVRATVERRQHRLQRWHDRSLQSFEALQVQRQAALDELETTLRETMQQIISDLC